MNRKAWIAFVVVQFFGEFGPWGGLHMKSSLGPVLWVTGWAVMMPGRTPGMMAPDFFRLSAVSRESRLTLAVAVVDTVGGMSAEDTCRSTGEAVETPPEVLAG